MFDIPHDKALHVIAGLIVFILAAAAGAYCGIPAWRELAVVAAFVVGLLKELTDYLANRRALAEGRQAPHGVEAWDVVATTCGGALGWLAALPGAFV